MIRRFDAVPDPRDGPNQQYALTDLLALIILAALSGAEGPTDVAQYAEAKKSGSAPS